MQAVVGGDDNDARFEIEDTELDVKRIIRELKAAGGTVAQADLKVHLHFADSRSVAGIGCHDVRF